MPDSSSTAPPVADRSRATAGQPGALTLLMQRLRKRGPLHALPPADAVDYYGSVSHFPASSTGRGYVVVPPDPLAPEPHLHGLDRWQWMQALGAEGPHTRLRQLCNGFGVSRSALDVACALELLSALVHLSADDGRTPGKERARARLLAIGSIETATGGEGAGLNPRREFVRAAWNGLFLLMTHALDAAGSRWEDVPGALFPLLAAQQPGEGASPSLLSAWPGGYVHWIERVQELQAGEPLDFAIDARADWAWTQIARLPGLERRGPSERDWVTSFAQPDGRSRRLREGREVLFITRPKDGLLAKSWSGIGQAPARPGVRTPGEAWKHASPLALLMAAIAADAHIATTPSLFHELRKRMDMPANELRRPPSDYETLWITTSARLRDVLQATPPRQRPGPATERFAVNTPPAAFVFEAEPVALTDLALIAAADDPDATSIRVTFPRRALGDAADAHLQRWQSHAVPCFVEVERRLGAQVEPYGLTTTLDLQEDDAGQLQLVLRPEMPPGSAWRRVRDGQVDPRLVTLRGWLVNGMPAGAVALPVVVVRVELLVA